MKYHRPKWHIQEPSVLFGNSGGRHHSRGTTRSWQMFILTIWLQPLCNIASKDSYITRFAFNKLYRQRCQTLRHPSITLWHHSQKSLKTMSERYIRNICALWTRTSMNALQLTPAFKASALLFERGVNSTLVFLWSQSRVAGGFLLLCNLKSLYYVWFLMFPLDTDIRTACLTLNEIINL